METEPNVTELLESLRHLSQYCKELMTENIAMNATLREIWQVNWKLGYRAYLEMAGQSTAATFRELEHALSQGTGIQREIDKFVMMHPVSRPK